ncbi:MULTISPECIES: amidase [unclassified Ruegeria]|uniref:amidase n=1 Tax=unclassified Ruegeria TaxID=2625375 RepID=UPI0014893CF9|nr:MULTISPECIES: amidase [unclassified Ruegeria]
MSASTSNQLDNALDALARSEDKVHAFRHLMVSGAQAGEAGAHVNTQKHRIKGWPFAVKEVFDVAGVVTSGGSKAYKDRVPSKDATAIERLRAAGGILVGTQIAHELTCGLDQPPTRNPWNVSCYPGGSSAGAGVSVAVGSARFALGTDAAGSVRIPAAMTGTTGLKPTWGLISSHGVMRQASAPSIDHVGIIARSAADLSQILPILAGPDPWDKATLQNQPAHRDRYPTTSKIAVLGEATFEAVAQICDLDPEVKAAFSDAVAVFNQIGIELIEIDIPTLRLAVDATVTFFSAELACANARTLNQRRDDFAPAVAEMIDSGLGIPKDQLRNAVQIRSQLRRELAITLRKANVQALLTPTTPRPAMPLADFDPTQELASLVPFTCGFNLTGNPALSLPCGQTQNGLPIGLQMVGHHYEETSLLELAQKFQELTHWHKLRPPV